MNSSQFAVEFGKNVDKGFEGGMNAWPFIYTFNPENTPQSPNVGLQGYGAFIPALGHVDATIILEPDYMYMMTAIKYTAVKDLARGAPFTDQEYTPGVPAFYFNYTNPLTSVHNSILRNTRINLSIAPSFRLLYGQENPRQQTTELRSPFPVCALNINTMLSGDGKVRVPMLLAANSHLSFEIFNDWSFPIVVGATVFGVKVRV
jgi:hypothetical protein